jgi:hypothetical protein
MRAGPTMTARAPPCQARRARAKSWRVHAFMAWVVSARRDALMDFRKTYFLLPNLFTLAGMFCGFYAIAVCARLTRRAAAATRSTRRRWRSSSACSSTPLDGRIARLTKTQTELGLHLDSLADVVTFGVAPAFVVYRWGLEGLGRSGCSSRSCSSPAARCGWPASTCSACAPRRTTPDKLEQVHARPADPGRGDGDHLAGDGLPRHRRRRRRPTTCWSA